MPYGVSGRAAAGQHKSTGNDWLRKPEKLGRKRDIRPPPTRIIKQPDGCRYHRAGPDRNATSGEDVTSWLMNSLRLSIGSCLNFQVTSSEATARFGVV
jgi:hypothetical protein